ncbi:thioredoxin [Apibacter adventoris]|uniref:Thioredoxin n=1 Tax=Apibacter adventoris TaxID=1679466 RepID=A0A2S8A981_9FLAO|nr:thioredoxin [Apibacter adventoris]PQL91036.1 thioredoxin [Apibacter adventoris]PQL95108.1 thioredoxin [Apibacter adventoris]
MAIEITDQSFKEEVLSSNTPVLVDFWAEWCGPCRSLSPIVEELSEEFKGKIKVVKLDIDSNQEIPVEYGIRNIPTLLFIKNGEVVDKVVGVQPKEKLVEKLQSLL